MGFLEEGTSKLEDEIHSRAVKTSLGKGNNGMYRSPEVTRAWHLEKCKAESLQNSRRATIRLRLEQRGDQARQGLGVS